MVEFIIGEIKKNSNVIEAIKKTNKKDNLWIIGILSCRLPTFGDPELILLELY
ncbi:MULTISPECIES: hypothetical protein [Staphylococcus]|uniref:hypothetical protein n=1 Tax=Staphylococcus TaxID=1279 RepID=UPI0034E57589